MSHQAETVRGTPCALHTAHAASAKAKEEPAAIDNPADGLAHASLLSKLTFRWVFTLIALGRTRPLVEGDLPQTPKPERASALYESLESRWQHELQRSSSPSFARALFFNMLPALVPAGLTALGNSTAKIAQALALGYAAAPQICTAWVASFPRFASTSSPPDTPLTANSRQAGEYSGPPWGGGQQWRGGQQCRT